MLQELMPLLPEIFVLTMVCAILLVDLFLTEKTRAVTYYLSLFTLVGAFVLTWPMLQMPSVIVFSDHFIHDHLASLLKLAIYVVTFFVFVYAYDYLRTLGLKIGEFYVLALFSMLGMMVLTSAGSLLTVYLGLELLSLPLYAMVALLRTSKLATEAAMKYFVMGALASSMLLYGMSLIYGMTGHLAISEIAQITANLSAMQQSLVGLGVVFIVVGIAFKFGAVPFHMWIPDIYSGATTATTLFIASASKLAAFALAARLLFDALGGVAVEWHNMLLIVAILSLAIGNVVALVQTNLKRLLAYSTIGHMGFILLAFVAGNLTAGLFYVITYAIMAVASFAMIIALSRQGFEAENISDFAGLNQTHPWYAFIMMLLMFSLAGVPPLVGFYAKFIVLDALVNAGLTSFAIIAVIFSVVGAFYYLRVVKTLYFDEPAKQPPAIAVSKPMQIALSINGLAILLLGLFPGVLLTLLHG